MTDARERGIRKIGKKMIISKIGCHTLQPPNNLGDNLKY